MFKCQSLLIHCGTIELRNKYFNMPSLEWFTLFVISFILNYIDFSIYISGIGYKLVIIFCYRICSLGSTKEFYTGVHVVQFDKITAIFAVLFSYLYLYTREFGVGWTFTKRWMMTGEVIGYWNWEHLIEASSSRLEVSIARFVKYFVGSSDFYGLVCLNNL